MASMLARGSSDKKIREATGKSQEELLRAGNSIREKLGVSPGGSIREAARSAGLHKK